MSLWVCVGFGCGCGGAGIRARQKIIAQFRGWDDTTSWAVVVLIGTWTDLHVIGVEHLGNAFAQRAAGGRVEQPNDVRVGFIPNGDSGAEAAEDELAPLEHGLGCTEYVGGRMHGLHGGGPCH